MNGQLVIANNNLVSEVQFAKRVFALQSLRIGMLCKKSGASGPRISLSAKASSLLRAFLCPIGTLCDGGGQILG